MRPGIFFVIALLTGLVALCPQDAAAAIIVFDNYGAGWAHDPVQGWTIGGGAGESWHEAFAFAPSQGGPISDIWLTLGLVRGSNAVDVWLAADVKGKVGAVLGQWTLQGQMPPIDGAYPVAPVHVEVPRGGPTLSANTPYWLGVSPVSADTSAAWYWSPDPLDIGPSAYRNGLVDKWHTSASDTQGVFRVGVTDLGVPEPATMLLMGLGAAAALAARFRRRYQ